MEETQSLELLRPFTSVKDLHLSEDSFPFISPALQELSGERVTEVLPALQNLFLTGPIPSGPFVTGSQPSGPVKEVIRKFTATRQRAGCPITVRHRGYTMEGYKDWEVDD